MEAREGVACGSCRCGGFSPAWVVTARPARAGDSALSHVPALLASILNGPAIKTDNW